MQWRKVSQGYSAAGMALSISSGSLGPASLCPACAVMPAEPEEAADSEEGASTSTGGRVISC